MTDPGPPPYVFRLQRSTLRPLRSEDAPSIAWHADSRRVWRNLRDGFPHPYRLTDAEAFIASHTGLPPLALAIEVDAAAVGVIGLQRRADVERGTLEVGYWLGEAYWGRGIVTEALQAVTEYAFITFPARRVEARVYGWNPASCRVLEKAGYTFEARLRSAITKDDEVTDALVYAVVR